MKIMKKQLLGLGLAAILTVSALTGCGNSSGGTTAATDNSQAKEKYLVAINQFSPHGSLENCREGFIEGLKEAGFVEGENIEFKYQNAQTEPATANQIAQQQAALKADLICAIATPSAQSVYNAVMKMDTPVIYTAVTDPVTAGLAKEDGASVGNVTGTSDKLPVEEQLIMIREVLPEAKKIGILYTTSEANSIATIETYKELAGKYDFEIIEVGISTQADIPMAVDSILAKVDCLSNLTDNTVVRALPTVLEKASAKKIPVFGSEIEQVKLGCLAAEGIDYIALGKQTGAMAAKILKDEAKASDLSFERIEESSLYLNYEAAKNLNITFKEDLIKRATETFDKIGE